MYQPDHFAKYLEKSRQRDFDISIIRKELTVAGVADAEITRIVRRVDNAIIQRNDRPTFANVAPGLAKAISVLFIILGSLFFVHSIYINLISYLRSSGSKKRLDHSLNEMLTGGALLFYGIRQFRRFRSQNSQF